MHVYVHVYGGLMSSAFFSGGLMSTYLFAFSMTCDLGQLHVLLNIIYSNCHLEGIKRTLTDQFGILKEGIIVIDVQEVKELELYKTIIQ